MSSIPQNYSDEKALVDRVQRLFTQSICPTFVQYRIAKEAHKENEEKRKQVAFRALIKEVNAEKTRKRSNSVAKLPKANKEPMMPADMGRQSLRAGKNT